MRGQLKALVIAGAMLTAVTGSATVFSAVAHDSSAPIRAVAIPGGLTPCTSHNGGGVGAGAGDGGSSGAAGSNPGGSVGPNGQGGVDGNGLPNSSTDPAPLCN